MLVTHGLPYPTSTPLNGGNLQNPGVTLEQPPQLPLPGQGSQPYPVNNECCSIVYPPFICQFNSSICYYINPPNFHVGEP